LLAELELECSLSALASDDGRRNAKEMSGGESEIEESEDRVAPSKSCPDAVPALARADGDDAAEVEVTTATG